MWVCYYALAHPQCENYASGMHITSRERSARDYAFWTVYVQDGVSKQAVPQWSLTIQLRALAAGRQPMLRDAFNVPFPQIDPEMDGIPWTSPRPLPSPGDLPGISHGSSLAGHKSMRSTAFHWMARLAVINRTVLETL